MLQRLFWIAAVVIVVRARPAWCDRGAAADASTPHTDPHDGSGAAGEPPEDPAKEAASIDDTRNAAEAEGSELPDKQLKWNELDLRVITLRVGGGILLDWATYEQSAASHAQMPVQAAQQLRDFRLLLKG